MILTADLPNNTPIVLKAIKCNTGRYENFIHRYFVLWSEVMADRFNLEDRSIIANESIYKYYKKQWKLLVENKFVIEVGCYVKEGVEETSYYLELLSEYALQLEKNYPEPLFKQLEK